MKNFKKLLLLISCIFMLCGCDIYVYDINGNNQNNSTNQESTSSTNTGSGSIIIKNDKEEPYEGIINYTEDAPTEDTPWNIIYDKVKSSVVSIRNIKGGKIVSTGSGVFFTKDISKNGFAYIYTNAHVVKDAASIEVLLSNGILAEGKLVGFDTNEDVAVVKIHNLPEYAINTVTLRYSETLRIGEEVLAIGSPLGEKYSETATSGIISNLNIAVAPDNSSLDLYLIQIDAALNPGNSGGPLFDKAGNLIGINTIKLVNSGTTTNIESFNYAIPISHFSLVANYLLNGSPYYRPYIGISIVDIRFLTKNEREQRGIKIHNGLLILEIEETSNLYGNAKVNNIITHIQNKPVLKDSDFSIELLKYYPGETITLTICDSYGDNSKNIQVELLNR